MEFAPDGVNFFEIKKGSVGRMWDYFNFNKEIREQIFLNPQAKFRLRNKTEGTIIGVLPRK